jgi:hypothetical protein
LSGVESVNSAFYFPWLIAPDPVQGDRLRAFPPSGYVAGVYARTDATQGVWKAPAGTEAAVSGASGVKVSVTDGQSEALHQRGINCIRSFPDRGIVCWGARTLHGNEESNSDWKYVSVRRLFLFIEESIYRGTQWVIFEPNDEPLWAQLRFQIGDFLQRLFRQGAFQGDTPREAYFVKCDRETTTQEDIDRGIVNILVGVAPLKPAEFVIIRIQQSTGQLRS